MSWEDLLKGSFGSNEGYNKLALAAEVVTDIKMAIEEGYNPSLFGEDGLLTDSVMEKIEADEDRIANIVEGELVAQLEILAELFR